MQEKTYNQSLIFKAFQIFINLNEAVGLCIKHDENNSPIDDLSIQKIAQLIHEFSQASLLAAQDSRHPDKPVSPEGFLPAIIEILKNLEEKEKVLETFNSIESRLEMEQQYICVVIISALTYLLKEEVAREKIVALESFLTKELELNASCSSTREHIFRLLDITKEKADYFHRLQAVTNEIQKNRSALPGKILQGVFNILVAVISFGSKNLLKVRNPFHNIYDELSKQLESLSEKELHKGVSHKADSAFWSSPELGVRVQEESNDPDAQTSSQPGMV